MHLSRESPTQEPRSSLYGTPLVGCLVVAKPYVGCYSVLKTRVSLSPVCWPLGSLAQPGVRSVSGFLGKVKGCREASLPWEILKNFQRMPGLLPPPRNLGFDAAHHLSPARCRPLPSPRRPIWERIPSGAQASPLAPSFRETGFWMNVLWESRADRHPKLMCQGKGGVNPPCDPYGERQGLRSRLGLSWSRF